MFFASWTTRVLGLGLGLAGLIGLIAQSTLGQQADQNAQQAKAEQSQPPAPSIKPPMIATIDLRRVIQEYDRYQESSDQFKAETLRKQQELEAMLSKAQEYSEKMNQFKPGTPEYQKWSDELADVSARYEAQRQQINNDISIRESNALADIYNDIRRIVAWYAKHNGITMVTQAGPSQPISGENPEEVMGAISQNVIYQHSSHDISESIIYWLNTSYQDYKNRQNGGSGSGPQAGQQQQQNAPRTPSANANDGN